MKNFTKTIILCLLSVGSISAQLESDSLELIKIYNATDGANWTNAWDLEAPVSEWYGISLVNERVKFIQLQVNNLTGSLPDLDMDEVSVLNLGDNNLSGTIPAYNKLTSLTTFWVSDNELSGGLPSFDTAPLLRAVYCENNMLEGSIPGFLNSPELETFVAGNNQFSGEIPSLDHFTNIQLYNVHNNQLTGELPAVLPNTINAINCFENQLTGELPVIVAGTGIQVLNCADNQLSGPIPVYEDLPNLLVLNINNNNLSGGIPEFIDLPRLSNYDCSHNNLTGELPTLAGTPMISNFYCNGNQMSGTIPDYDYLADLSLLNCANNLLSGELPDVSDWASLSSLIVEDNQLSGPLPVDVPEGFSQLQSSRNNFSGCYPDYICELWRFGSIENPLLPWLGDHEPFCAGDDQIGAPCDDGLTVTTQDAISEDCFCTEAPLAVYENNTGERITCYPNPALNEIMIDGDLPASFVVQISDLSGRIVLSLNSAWRIPTTGLRPGTYLLQVLPEDGSYVSIQKIVLQ